MCASVPWITQCVVMFALLAVTVAASVAPSSSHAMLWSSVSVNIDESSIVADATVEARPGRLLGVLGPSGTGKSTLLRALAGTTPYGRRRSVQGRRTSNVPEPFQIAMLAQSESFFSMLTVRETLSLAASLQPSAHSKGQQAESATVDALLQTLGLERVQHVRVGDATHRGISGGERRRLAVGCELLGEPLLLVADEPTTGLDSFQAERTMRLISRTVADRNIPGVATLHQPRSSIWAQLDDVLLLAPGGRVVYHGAREKATAYFERLGFDCPGHTNPAEFLIDLVSTDTDSPEHARSDAERIDRLVAAWAQDGLLRTRTLDGSGSAGVAGHPGLCDSNGDARVQKQAPRPARPREQHRAPRMRRLGLLLRRSWRQNVRDKWVNGVRLAVSTGLALVFGEIFGRLGPPCPATVAERIALLSYATINMAMLAVMKTLDLLGRERPVVARERARGQYGALEYVLAKFVTELPLDAIFAAGFGALLHWRVGLRLPAHTLVSTLALTAAASAGVGFAVGALASSSDTSLAAGIGLLVVYMVLGVINPAGAAAKPPSRTVQLLSHLSPIKWSIRALVCAEFRGLELAKGSLRDAPRMGGLALVSTGDQVLERLALKDATCGQSCQRLAQLLTAELAVAFVGLIFTRPRFQPMEEPVL